MKNLIVFILCLSIITSAYAEKIDVFIEGIDKQMVNNTLASITVIGKFYLTDNIPHSFQVSLQGDDLKGNETVQKNVAKGKIKHILKDFIKDKQVANEKSNAWDEGYSEDIQP